MLTNRSTGWLFILCTCAALPLAAVEPPPGIKIIHDLPRSQTEIRSAYDTASTQACDYLVAGMPIEFNSFTAYLTDRDKREKLKSVPNPSTRRHMFTVGVEIAKEDVPKLPKLSSGLITDYLATHYVAVQAKIQKDPGTNVLYLHHRPIAATTLFRAPNLAEDFDPAVASTVRSLHSLGIYVPLKTEPKPEVLRTVVLVHKHTAVEANIVRPGAERLEPRYEFVFVRGRPVPAGNKLDLHVFVTSDERRQLHYLKSGHTPRRPTDCSLKAEVTITKYGAASLKPEESATRRQVIASRGSFTVTELDAFTKRNLSTKGDAFDNLNNTLDAILDGKIAPTAKPAGK